MRRRTVLAAATAGATAAVAGCGVLDSGDRQHPFAGTTVTVRVDNESSSDHNLDANAREALEFWETNSPKYAGFEIGFDIVTDEDPEMVIRYGDEPRGCEDLPEASDRVLGCAPKLGPNTTVPDPVVASVVATRPLGLVLITAKHEVGHVLGLSHSDPPRTIMSGRPADRVPLHQARIDTLDAVLDARERATEGASLFARGVGEWNDRNYTSARASLDSASTALAETRDALDATWASFETAVDEQEARRDLPVAASRTLDMEGLRALFDRIVGRAETAAGFTAKLADAAAAARDGEPELANQRQEEASRLAADFRELDAVPVSALASALGLTRDYDRAALVIPVDADAI